MTIAKENKLADIWDDLYKNHLDILPWVSNPKPLDILDDFVSKLINRNTVLDYGAGDGVFKDFLSKNFKEITFAEISKEAIKLCKNKSSTYDKSFQFIITDFPDKHLFNNKKFDGIILWGVIHHIKKRDWTDFMKAFYNILSNNGIMLVGAHSKRDVEFHDVRTISSPYTSLQRYPIDTDFETIVREIGFNVSKEGKFPFVEAITGKQRDFNYYILIKNE